MRIDINASKADILRHIYVLSDMEKEVLLAYISLNAGHGVLVIDISKSTGYTVYEVEKAIMSSMRKIKS